MKESKFEVGKTYTCDRYTITIEKRTERTITFTFFNGYLGTRKRIRWGKRGHSSWIELDGVEILDFPITKRWGIVFLACHLAATERSN